MGAIVMIITYGYYGQISETDLETVTRIIMGDTNLANQQLDNLDFIIFALSIAG